MDLWLFDVSDGCVLTVLLIIGISIYTFCLSNRYKVAVATAAPPVIQGNNRVYLFRLLTLTIDEGTTLVRNIFDDKRLNVPLKAFLAQEMTSINRLKRSKTITSVQYDLLFPQSGIAPKTDDFDLTLIVCLLRNLRVFGLNRHFQWNSLPQPGDISLEADLRRLQLYRNEFAHISTTTGVQETDFETKWGDLEQVLHRLNASVSNPVQNLQQIIDDCLTRPLDQEEQERINEIIETMQTRERELEVVMRTVEDLNIKVADWEKQKDKYGAEYAKEEYLEKRKYLKEDLITLYRQQYHTLPLSPLIEKHDTPLLDFYVMPDINIVESQMPFGGIRELKSRVTSLHDVFYKKSKLCREINLVANAGLGKTAFSKRLALTWCQAHKCKKDETKCFEKEETDAMSEFDFVFLLSLRDCSKECDIDQMIRKQILPRLAHKSDIIENVLSEEKCLVILDGLDEWVHPSSSCVYGQSDIPHRKARECTTIITTARPWKLSLINLKSSQIDKKLELDGLSKMSRIKLKKSVITLLSHEAEKTTEDQIANFDSTVAEKGVSDLESVPLLLMYLLCLWCDEIDLGRSKCVIYCQIVELLLKRTFGKQQARPSTCHLSTKNIPQCFDAQTNCRENYTFLSSLGELAFETLFSKTRENTLVFDRLVVDEYLNADMLSLSLCSGIITQDKEVKLTSEKQKTSFSHKTVQEFFAALHISTCSDQDKVLKEVLSSCKCVKDIIEMSEVFIFLSGINAELFSSVSEKLMKVINEDEIARTYRSVTYTADYFNYITPVKEIQDMSIFCIAELPENSDLKMCLQDVIFDKSCQQENYYTNLQRLAVQNKNNLKSISIEMEGIRSLQEIITQCELGDPSINCQKIYFKGECKEAELIPLLSRSVNCVTIASSEWRDNQFEDKNGIWSPELTKIVQNNVRDQLRAINLQRFNFNHDALEEILNYLVKSKSMKEIGLHTLLCNDHGTPCPGFNFDLSQHNELRCVGLSEIPLSQLNINVSLLGKCHVGDFSNPGIVKSYLSNISAASKLQTFYCDSLESSDDIQTMLQTLSLLVTVKHVWLLNMDLGASLLPHEIVNIEYVVLCKVTMSSSSLRNLVSWIKNLPQQVAVGLADCKITPKIEFEEIKENIRKSEKIVVVYDGEQPDGVYGFVFKSIK